jgi:hypothetical protein
MKGASKDSSIPQRFMPVKTAFDMDDVQLFDYCQRNELLENPEISSIFGKDFSQTDSTRERKRETSVTDDTKTVPRGMHAGMQECHAAKRIRVLRKIS